MRLSATKLKTFLACPRKYRYAYVDQIPSLPTLPLLFGRAVHQAIHDLEAVLSDPSMSLPLHESAALFRCIWSEFGASDECLFKHEAAKAQEYQSLGEQMLRDYVRALKRFPPALAVEYPFTIPWREHALTGVIDRIEEEPDGVTLVEFKTSQRKPSGNELASDLQLTVYAYAVQAVFDQKVKQIIYYHLRDHSAYSVLRTPEQLAHFSDCLLPEVVEAIEVGVSTPTYGWHCKHCEYRELCRAEGPDDAPLIPLTSLTYRSRQEPAQP